MPAAKKPQKPMTKTQLVAHLAEECELTKKQTAHFLDVLTQTAYKEAKKGGLTIPGIGKLALVQRKARKGHNPQTGEPIKIPARKAVTFRVAKACKDSVLPAK